MPVFCTKCNRGVIRAAGTVTAPPSRLIKDEYETPVHVENNTTERVNEPFRGVPGKSILHFCLSLVMLCTLLCLCAQVHRPVLTLWQWLSQLLLLLPSLLLLHSSLHYPSLLPPHHLPLPCVPMLCHLLPLPPPLQQQPSQPVSTMDVVAVPVVVVVSVVCCSIFRQHAAARIVSDVAFTS